MVKKHSDLGNIQTNWLICECNSMFNDLTGWLRFVFTRGIKLVWPAWVWYMPTPWQACHWSCDMTGSAELSKNTLRCHMCSNWQDTSALLPQPKFGCSFKALELSGGDLHLLGKLVLLSDVVLFSASAGS